MGARILSGAVIERQCTVGAGALITEGKRFESSSLVVGAPPRVVRKVTDEERKLRLESAAHYAEKAARYVVALKAL
jgi:carbonic anhydrase/acetyltransferase-like protein (isoleucine patch superfamily)